MRLTLIITGGIAAYKAQELVRLMVKAGHQVTPILTASAKQFVTPLSLEVIARQSVYDDLFAPGQESGIGHIQLARQAEAIVVAPATAHFMAKVALGLADDLASTVMLAADQPILMAPAMNPTMWQATPMRQHVQTLQQRSVRMVGPNAGDTACGEDGIGRMAEPAEIMLALDTLLATTLQKAAEQPLRGRTVVLTAGPTQEAIDPVRYISNHSSGKQAVAIAAAAHAAGAEVIVIHGPMSATVPAGCQAIAVTTAQQMLEASLSWRQADAFIAVAAVADWRSDYQPEKIRKSGKQQAITLKLLPNTDILATMAQADERPQCVVGFAAEAQAEPMRAMALAQQKLQRKGCDMLMFNPINPDNAAFGVDENHLYCLRQTPSAIISEDWGRHSKTALARRLVNTLADILEGQMPSPSCRRP